MILGLGILYIGLTILDMYYDFEWENFSVGLLFLSLLITLLCLIDGRTTSTIIWFVIFLFECLSVNKTEK
jgi:hypothetical protein